MADGNVFEMQIEIWIRVAAYGLNLFDDFLQVSVDERVERVDMMTVEPTSLQVFFDQKLFVAKHFDHFSYYVYGVYKKDASLID